MTAAAPLARCLMIWAESEKNEVPAAMQRGHYDWGTDGGVSRCREAPPGLGPCMRVVEVTWFNTFGNLKQFAGTTILPLEVDPLAISEWRVQNLSLI
jgi:hypothetical protein